MGLVDKLEDLKKDAESLESKCDSIYSKILYLEPFEGPGLERQLRRLEADAEKYLRKAQSISGLTLKVSSTAAEKVNDLWEDINLSTTGCCSTLVSARSYLEDTSLLVAIGSALNDVVSEITRSLKSSLRLVETKVTALLAGS